MRSIGLRASAKEVYYAIFEGDKEQPTLVHHHKLIAPKAFDVPQALSWYREQFLNICNEYTIKACFVRTAEPMAKSANKPVAERARVEGVLVEASASSGINVKLGPLATVSSLMGTKSAKTYLSSDEFRGVDGWDTLNDSYKEASIAGVAALALLGE